MYIECHFYSIIAMFIYINCSVCFMGYYVVSTGKDFFGSSKAGRHQAHDLLVHVCDCLYRCFLYDTEGFVTKERFDTLLQPLVDQVTDTLLLSYHIM